MHSSGYCASSSRKKKTYCPSRVTMSRRLATPHSAVATPLLRRVRGSGGAAGGRPTAVIGPTTVQSSRPRRGREFLRSGLAESGGRGGFDTRSISYAGCAARRCRGARCGHRDRCCGVDVSGPFRVGAGATMLGTFAQGAKGIELLGADPAAYLSVRLRELLGADAEPGVAMGASCVHRLCLLGCRAQPAGVELRRPCVRTLPTHTTNGAMLFQTRYFSSISSACSARMTDKTTSPPGCNNAATRGASAISGVARMLAITTTTGVAGRVSAVQGWMRAVTPFTAALSCVACRACGLCFLVYTACVLCFVVVLV